MPENRNYTPTTWVDHFEDPASGEVFQQGTLVDAQHLNNIEGGIVDAHYKADAAQQSADGKAPSNHTHAPGEVGAAPSNHTHTAGEVGAAPSNHTHTPGELGASPSNHSHNLLTYTVTHSKSGTAHTLTGLPTAAGIYIAQFKAVANFDAGNTFAGGYTAKPMGEETALPDKAFITGDLVSVVVDVSGKKLGFRVGGAGAPKFPTYTGAHAIFGTEKQGYMELYSSGTLTPQSTMLADAFLVGGGGAGGYAAQYSGGGGGGGGRVKLLTGLSLVKDTAYSATVGSGGTPTNETSQGNSGGNTTMFGNVANGGVGGYGAAYANSVYRGDGGSGGSGGGGAGGHSSSNAYDGGNGGSNGADGVHGQNTSWGDGGVGGGISTTFNSKTYAGGGGGGSTRTGGLGVNGGGNGGNALTAGSSAITSTGSGGGGGGGGASATASITPGGSGGSGIIIIRWGY